MTLTNSNQILALTVHIERFKPHEIFFKPFCDTLRNSIIDIFRFAGIESFGGLNILDQTAHVINWFLM